MAEAVCEQQRGAATQAMKTVDTPGAHSIEAVSALLGIEPKQTLKTLIVRGEIDEEGRGSPLVALCLRGDHELNAIKAEKLDLVASPLQMADQEAIREAIGCDIGSIGPVGLDIPVIADRCAAALADFVCGANDNDRHLMGVNWGRDLPEPMVADLRNVVEGDPSPDGKGRLHILRGIEVGHIFQLGDKYSRAMKAEVLDENGRARTVTMGCYGIGISRVVAAAIEQNNDDRGIRWPQALAPFALAICPINYHKSDPVRQAADAFYQWCRQQGLDVLLDDRPLRPGAMFADMELIGIPHRVVFSERGLKAGTFEYKGRADEASEDVAMDRLQAFVSEKLG
jgi:prolyl-tRNA synthetase